MLKHNSKESKAQYGSILTGLINGLLESCNFEHQSAPTTDIQAMLFSRNHQEPGISLTFHQIPTFPKLFSNSLILPGFLN